MKKPDGKKAVKKEKELIKIAEDRTFGLKNKKNSKKVQQVVKGLAAATSKGGYDKIQEEIYLDRQRKKAEEEEKKLLADVFANSVNKTVTTSTGEEVMICKMFEAGLCTKGKKCKYSHNIQSDPMKVDKIDLYTDQRDLIFGNKDTIDHWDKEKLQEVVGFNEARYNAEGRTEKICKSFLEAVEKKIYGWNWVCPSGYNCIFKHCLPPGYELPSAKKFEKQERITDDDVIEEIDNAREKLNHKDLTPVTFELFSTWLVKRKARLEKENDEKVKDDLKSMGVKIKKGVTGKELFEKDKDIFKDAEDAVEEYKREEEDVDVDENLFDNEEMPDI